MRRRAYTRDELAAAVALAVAAIAAAGIDLPAHASGAVRLHAIRSRAPKGSFTYADPNPPTADQLALVDQLRMGMLAKEHRERKFGGPQASYEPSGAKETVAGWLGTLGFFGSSFLGPVFGPHVGGASLKLTQAATASDTRRQLLDLSYIPSPPDRRTYPWSLLSEAELSDVKRRLYGPGGPVAQRVATGY
jgi:hypothetical protein